MENYTLHIVEDDEGNFFHCVFEEQTQQVYDFFYFLDDADACIKFLNDGGAFAGFTPSFMLREVNMNKSADEINVEFDDL